MPRTLRELLDPGILPLRLDATEAGEGIGRVGTPGIGGLRLPKRGQLRLIHRPRLRERRHMQVGHHLGLIEAVVAELAAETEAAAGVDVDPLMRKGLAETLFPVEGRAVVERDNGPPSHFTPDGP